MEPPRGIWPQLPAGHAAKNWVGGWAGRLGALRGRVGCGVVGVSRQLGSATVQPWQQLSIYTPHKPQATDRARSATTAAAAHLMLVRTWNLALGKALRASSRLCLFSSCQ